MKWLLRLSTIALLTFLILCNSFAQEADAANPDMSRPSDETIEELYQRNPQLIYSMIRRLYWIERIPIYVEKPKYDAVLMKDGTLLLIPYYKDNKVYADAHIEPFLQYEIYYPQITIENFAEDRRFNWVKPALVGSGIGFFVGVGAALLVVALMN